MPDLSIDDLRVAFAFHVARLIVDADDKLHPDEVAFLRKVFPPEMLEQHGLDDEGLKTALSAALVMLPEALSADEKLDLVDLFVHACMADGELHPREAAVMTQAAQALGVPDKAFADRVRATLTSRGPLPPIARGDTTPVEAPSTLAVGQAVLRDALAPVDADGLALRERILSTVRDPDGLLIVTATRDEVEEGDVSGWQALIALLHAEGLSLASRGRLGLEVEGFDDDPRALAHIPAAREWLAWLTRSWPWLGTWVTPELGGVQLVLALAPEQTDARGVPVRSQELLSAAVWMANWGVAYAARLGWPDEDHARGLLAVFGVSDLPHGFFEGANARIRRLHADGTLLR